MNVIGYVILSFALGFAVALFLYVIIYAIHNKDRDSKNAELRERNIDCVKKFQNLVNYLRINGEGIWEDFLKLGKENE